MSQEQGQKEQEIFGRRAFLQRLTGAISAGILAATIPTTQAEAARSIPLNLSQLPHLLVDPKHRHLTNFGEVLVKHNSYWYWEIFNSDYQATVVEAGHLGEPPAWEQILNTLNQLEAIDSADKMIIGADIEKAMKDLGPYYKQLKEFNAIAKADLDEEGQPVLFRYFRSLKGKMNYHFDDISLIPFLSEQEKTANTIWMINNFVEMIAYLEKRGDLTEAKRRAQGVADAIREKMAREQLEKDWFDNLPKTIGEVSVATTDNLEEPTAQAVFEKHRQVAVEVIELFPQVKPIRIVLVLGSAEYRNGSAGLLLRSEAAGHAMIKDIPGGGRKYILIKVDVDQAQRAGNSLRVHIAHELGHALDTIISRPLTDQLTTQQWYQLVLEQQRGIHDNPDWGINDQNIEQLFSIKGGFREDQIDTSSDLISVEDAVSLMRTQAINYWLQNGFATNEKGVLVSLFDMFSSDRDGAIRILFGDSELGREYRTLVEFNQAYLPKLESYLNDRSIPERRKLRDRLVWLALTRHPDAFANFGFIWEMNEGMVPKKRQDVLSWLNYCNFIVSNAKLAQGVLDNDQEVMAIAWGLDRKLYSRIVQLRRVMRGEFAADAVSKSGLWRGRIKVDPDRLSNPFDLFLDKLAALLPPTI